MHKSFLDSIVVELCLPQSTYPKQILIQLLAEAIDETPRDAKRFPQELWDAMGDLSVSSLFSAAQMYTHSSCRPPSSCLSFWKIPSWVLTVMRTRERTVGHLRNTRIGSTPSCFPNKLRGNMPTTRICSSLSTPSFSSSAWCRLYGSTSIWCVCQFLVTVVAVTDVSLEL